MVKNKKRSKSAQAQIITVVLIILIVIVGILIVWNVFRPLIARAAERISLSRLKVDLEIDSAYIDENNQSIYVQIKRGTGKANLTALKFIFTDSNGKNYIYKYPKVEWIPGELETMVYNITAKGVRAQNTELVVDWDFRDIVSVGIAFVVRTSYGSEVTSGVKDVFGDSVKEDLREDEGLMLKVNAEVFEDVIEPEDGGDGNGITGNVYYVDPINGNTATGDGSSANPWGTLQEVFDAGLIQRRGHNSYPALPGFPDTDPDIFAIKNPDTSVVVDGDIIKLRTGYHGELDEREYYNTDYITIEAEDGHTPTLGYIRFESFSKWILRGLTVNIELSGVYNKNEAIISVADHGHYGGCSDIIIENCDVKTVSDASSSGWSADDWLNKASGGIGINGKNNIIRNNTIRNVRNAMSIGVNNTVVENNNISQFTIDCFETGGGDDLIFQNNICKNPKAVGIGHRDFFQTTGIASSSDRWIIRGNTFIEYEDPDQPFASHGIHGIFCPANGKDWIVKDNLVVIDHVWGIYLSNLEDAIISNNTVVRPPEGTVNGAPVITIGGDFNNVNIKNNIAHSIIDSTTGLFVSNNIELNDGYDAHDLFNDYDNYDFHPVMSSDACNGMITSCHFLTTGSYVGVLSCVDKTCPSGLDSECNDSSICTDETCVAGICEYTFNTNPCDDGLWCNGVDTCSSGSCAHEYPGGRCIDNGYGCIILCDEATQQCNVPNSGLCDDNNECTDGDVCDTIGIGYDYWNSSSGCGYNYNTNLCDDGIFCTENDGCSGGVCQGIANDSLCLTAFPDCTSVICDVNLGCINYQPEGCNLLNYVSYWKFEGNVNDENGVNDGTFYGGTPQFVSGQVGQALELDGAGNYVDVGDINEIDGALSFTITTWVKLDTSNGGIASRWVGSDAQFYFREDGSGLDCALRNSATDIGTVEADDLTLIVGQWYFVACTWDGATIEVYCDATKSTSSGSLSGNLMSSTDPVYIGTFGTGYLNGTIDDIRVYNRSLSATEIQEIYCGQGGTGTVCV